MLRLLPLVGLLAALLLGAPASAAPAARPLPAAVAPATPEAVPNEILVRFKSNADGSERAAARRAARVKFARDMRAEGAQVVEVEEGQSVGAAVRVLGRQGPVEHATRNWIFRASATVPNDPRLAAGELWGLQKIGAPDAWDLFKAAPDVVVAVVDTGVRYDHPDLDGNIWSNPLETADGADGADPGGLVDDLRGWDFIDHDNDPTDLNEHGTHVAGTIAAEGNNGEGITGVAWDAQIMPVRVLDENGTGSGDAVGDGLAYAAQMGAKVVNASLGAPIDDAGLAFYTDIFEAFPQTLFVLAAGNGGADGVGDDNDAEPHGPCNSAAANVVCVAATGESDELAMFSNFGATTVDIAAPGQGTMSTVPKVAATGAVHVFDGGLTGWSTAGSVGGSWTTFAYETGGTDRFLNELPTGGDYSFSHGEDLRLTSTTPFDLSGKKGCLLVHGLYHQYDFGRDALLVQTSLDGAAWTTRASFTGTNGGMQTTATNLHSDGRPSVYIRFRTIADDTTGTVPEGGWFGSAIDDLRIECQATPDASSYRTMDGTSMATPHVAGVATLLFGARPFADVAQVKTWLLTSGDSLPVLGGRITTGRRLNAHRALMAAYGLAGGPEAITDPAAEITDTAAKLKGRIDPNGAETAYKFLYGPAPDLLTSQAPAAPAAVGAGDDPVVVSQTVAGLTPGQPYYFKLVAIQNEAETDGLIHHFNTQLIKPPTVTSVPASDVTTTTARIGGTVNPHGSRTSVLLEWGTASGSYTTQSDRLSVGDGNKPVDISGTLVELKPGTQYYYRLRAGSSDGEAVSVERSFTTQALPGTGTGDTTTPGEPTASTVPPVAPPVDPGTAPLPAPISVSCKRSTAKRITCKAGVSAAAKVTVRIGRNGKVFARGTASSLTKGRALKIRTIRRVRKGRYKLQLTVVRDGVKTTVTRSIRL